MKVVQSLAAFLIAAFSIPSHAAVATFDASITAINPCDGSTMTAYGTTMLSIYKTSQGIAVYEHFSGMTNDYAVSYSGRGFFSAPSKTYKVIISGIWNGPKSFNSRGPDTIYTAQGLSPTGDKIKYLTNTCQ